MYHVNVSEKVGRTLGLARSRYLESSHVSRHVSRPVRNTSPRPNFTYRAGWSYPWTIDRGFLRPSRKFDTFRSRAKTIVHRSLRERSNCFREHFDHIQIGSRLFSEYLSLIRSKRNKFMVFRKHLSASLSGQRRHAKPRVFSPILGDSCFACSICDAFRPTARENAALAARHVPRACATTNFFDTLLSCFRYRELLINSSSFR